MVSNQKIDELLKSLDETILGMESGLNCDDETRKIVSDWLVSAQQSVQRTATPYCECGATVEIPHAGNCPNRKIRRR